MKGEAKRRSGPHWGRIAFGVGLTVCVAVGVTVGVLLGSGSEEGDADGLRRAAALALDTDRLNDDALTLAAAIEDAIAREALEGETASLRAELVALERRAEEMRASADAQLVRGGDAEATSSSPGSTATAQQSIREIDATLAVFEHEIVPKLGTVLNRPSTNSAASGGDSSDVVAGVTEALEVQDEALETVTSELVTANEQTESTTGGEAVVEEPDDLVSGHFDAVLEVLESPLAFEYELHSFDAEVEAGDATVEASLAGSALGELTVTSEVTGPTVVDLPDLAVVLYWEEDDMQETASEAEIGKCPFELDGSRYCPLQRFGFAAPEDTDGPAGIDLIPGEPLLFEGPGPEGSPLADEVEAGLVAEAIAATPPDLVQVLDTGAPAALRTACTSADAVTSEEQVYEEEVTVGLLSGDGTVYFEAALPSATVEANTGEVEASTGEDSLPPSCWDG